MADATTAVTPDEQKAAPTFPVYEDGLDTQKVYNQARSGYDDDASNAGFARMVYAQRFGLDKSQTLAQMTTAVHGSPVNPKAALKFVADSYKPVATETDPYDEFSQKSAEDQQTEAVKHYPMLADEPGFPKDVAARAYAGELREQSPKYRLLDAERSLPKDVVQQVRLASITHNTELMQQTLLANPASQQSIVNLARTYGDVYGDQLVPSDDKGVWQSFLKSSAGKFASNTVGSVVQGTKEMINQLGQFGIALTEDRFGSERVYNTLRGELGDQLDKLVTPEGKIDSPEAEQKIRDTLIASSHDFDREAAAKKADAVIADFQTQFTTGRNESAATKAGLSAQKLTTPVPKSQGFVADNVQSAIRFAPALLTMAIHPAIATAIGGSMATGLRNDMIYDYGLSPNKADTLAGAVAGVYAFGGRVLGGMFPVSEEAKASAIKVFGDEFEKGFTPLVKKVLVEGGKAAGETALTLEAMNVAKDAARSTGKILGDQDASLGEIWDQHFKDIPSTVMQSLLLGGASTALRAGAGVALRELPLKPGDLAKVPEAQQKEVVIGAQPTRVIGDQSLKPGENPEVDRAYEAERARIQEEERAVTQQQLAPENVGGLNEQEAGGEKKASPVLTDQTDRLTVGEQNKLTEHPSEGAAEPPPIGGELPTTVGDVEWEINKELSQRIKKTPLEVPEVAGPQEPSKPYNQPIRPLQELFTIGADGDPVVRQGVDPYEAHQALAALQKNEQYIRDNRGDDFYGNLVRQFTNVAYPGLPLGSEDVAPSGRLVSEETYKKNVKELKSKLGRVSMGVDPTILKNLLVAGAYHLENGLRDFAAWSKQMIKQFGEDVVPHLRDVWDNLRNDPRMAGHAAELKSAPTASDAAIDLAKRFARGEGFTNKKAQDHLEENYPGVPKQRTINEARYLASNLGDVSDTTATDLHAKVQEADAKMREDERVAKRNLDLYKKYYGEGRKRGDLETRQTGESVLHDMLGRDQPEPGSKTPSIRKLIMDAVRGGRKSAAPPVKTIAGDVLDTLESNQRSKSKQSKLLLYDDLHKQVEDAQRMIHFGAPDNSPALKGVLTDMFGSEQAKRIHRVFHEDGIHTSRDVMDAIDAEITARANGIRGENVVKGFKSPATLTANSQDRLAALREQITPDVNKDAKAAGAEEGNFGFHVAQLQGDLGNQSKLDMLQEKLDKGEITPEQFDKAAADAEGKRSGLLSFFKNESYDNMKALHDQMLSIMADSRQELYENEAKKVADAKARVPVVVGEVAESTKATYTPTKGEKFWQHTNEAAGDMVNRLGGLFKGAASVTRNILHTDVFTGRSDADLKYVELHDALRTAATNAGFSAVDIARMEKDFREIQFGDKKVSFSTAQMMEILASSERSSTRLEMSRAERLYGRHEEGWKDRGWRPTADTLSDDTLSEGSVENFLSTIREQLTPQQQAFAHEAVGIINDAGLREKVNDANEYHTGLPLTTGEPVYYPRRRPGTTDNPNAHLEGGSLKDIASFTKPTRSNTRPLVFDSIFRTTENYARQASLYAYVSPATDAARRLLNQPEVTTALDSAASREAVKRLHDAYSDAEGQSVQPESSDLAKWAKRGQTLYALWGNIGGAVGVRMYATGMAATRIAVDHGSGAAADFLLHSLTSIGPKTVFGFELHPQDIADLEVLKKSSGYVASRAMSSADTAETLVESAKDIAGDLSSPGALAALKELKNQLNAKGLQFYRNADQKTMVETYQWAQRHGMTPEDAANYTVDVVRKTQPPSSGFDYTRSYLWSQPVRLLFPFTGAVSRTAAFGSEMVARWQQAKTPVERAQAYKGLVYFALGTAATSVVGGAWNQSLWLRRTTGGVLPTDDDKTHYLRDVSLNAVSQGVSPLLGRSAEMLARAWDYKEDPTQITTVKGAGDVMRGLGTLVKAAGGDEGINWSDQKNIEAGWKVAEGVAAATHVQVRGIDENWKLIKGGERRDKN